MQRFCLAIALLFFAVSSAFGFSINDFTKTVIPIKGTDGTGIPANFAIDIDNDGNEEIVFTRIVNTFTDQTDKTFYKIYIFDNLGNDITSKYFDSDVNIQLCKHVFAADFNGDGKNDLMFITQGPDVHPLVGEPNRLFLSNSNDNKLTEHALPGPQDYSHEADIGDIDNDGDIDVLVVSHGNNTNCYFYINDGSGNFTKKILIDSIVDGYTFGSCSISDLNNDNYKDIVLGIWKSGDNPVSSFVLFGNKTGTFNFKDRKQLPLYNKLLPKSEIRTYATFAKYDINQDGYNDIVMSIYDDKCNQFAMQFLKNNKDNTFTDISDSILPINYIKDDQRMGPPQLIYGDIDGDSINDLIFGQIYLYRESGLLYVPDELPFALIAKNTTGDFSTLTINKMFPNIQILSNFYISAMIPLKIKNGIKLITSTLENSTFMLSIYTRNIAPSVTPTSIPSGSGGGGGGGCNIGSYGFCAILVLLPLVFLTNK